MIEIEEMAIRLCPECFGSLRVGDCCLHCESSAVPKSYWIDPHGDCLFELVSDKRAKSTD